MKNKKIIAIIAAVVFLTGCGNNTKETTIDLGMQAIEEHSYEEALDYFDLAITERKNLMLAYRGEGLAYIGIGQYPSAIASFTKALNQDGADKKDVKIDLLLYKGAAEYKNQDYTSALMSYNDVLELEQTSEYYYLRGTAYLANSQLDAANTDYEAAIALTPKDITLYTNIYESFMSSNLSNEGNAYLLKAVSALDEEETSVFDIGRLCYYMGDSQNAIAKLNQAVDAGEKEAIIYLGKVYQSINDMEHAMQMYNKYLSEVGASGDAYNGLAMCQIASGDYDGALNTIDLGILQQDDALQSLLFNQIVAYEKKLDFETAKVKSAEYVALYPSDEAGQKENEFLQTR